VLIVHVLCGELFLIAIPLPNCRISCCFCDAGPTGMDYGIKRGGMKSSGINW